MFTHDYISGGVATSDASSLD